MKDILMTAGGEIYNVRTDSFAESMSEVFWASQGVTDPLHSRPMARLRRALVQAQLRVKQYEAEALRTPEPSTASASAPPAPSADAWVEHAPQRLDNDTVARMVTEFKGLGARQRIFSNAIALCKGAHLAVLKAFDAKVLELCTQTWQPGHGLRNVTAEELLDADRKLWHSIAGLVEDQKFTLHEALHEFTNVRGDVHSLLQPRARTYAPPPAPHAPGGPRPPCKGLGKGRGGKTGSPNRPQRTIDKETSAAQLTQAMQNLQLTHGKKTLCLRYNKTQCTNASCKFEHRCAIRMPNGQACGGQRPAHKHRFKPAKPGVEAEGTASTPSS